MTDEWIDISLPLSAELVHWPGSIGFISKQHMSVEKGDDANVSHIQMDVHSGTHIDAPLHFLKDGRSVKDIPLEKLIGECFVLESLNGKSITNNDIERVPLGVKKLLIKTANSSLWSEPKHAFNEEYVALDLSGATAAAERGFDLLGVDYLSIQKFTESTDAHRVLLKKNIVLLEGIDLREVNEGVYDLWCLPVRMDDLEAAPCRALLKSR